MLTYKGYKTPAEFDAGYANNIDAAVVAHWEAFFRERSRALSAPRLELAYGPDERNEIDFFPALNAPPDAPILIAIHGGLWFLFDKWMMHFLVPAFTAAGVHVACPNYRLAPAVGLGDIVGDCRRAVAFVHENRDATGAGTGGMYVLGHSAAGQLAAAMASTNWPEFDPRLPADMLQRLHRRQRLLRYRAVCRHRLPAANQVRDRRLQDLESRQHDPRRHAAGPSHHRCEGIRPLARDDGWLCRACSAPPR